MDDKKKQDQKEYSVPNIGVHYYVDPIYDSISIVEFEDYPDEVTGKTTEQAKENEAPDEPIESWGWLN